MTPGSDRSKSLGLSYRQHASVLGYLRHGDWEVHRLHQLRQTVALFETSLAALEKCKGLLQDTVLMGEFAELTQTNTD